MHYLHYFITIIIILFQKKRGLLVSLNELGITLGLLLAYFVNYVLIDTPNGWYGHWNTFFNRSFGMCILFVLSIIAINLRIATHRFIVLFSLLSARKIHCFIRQLHKWVSGSIKTQIFMYNPIGLKRVKGIPSYKWLGSQLKNLN